MSFSLSLSLAMTCTNETVREFPLLIWLLSLQRELEELKPLNLAFKWTVQSRTSHSSSTQTANDHIRIIFRSTSNFFEATVHNCTQKLTNGEMIQCTNLNLSSSRIFIDKTLGFLSVWKSICSGIEPSAFLKFFWLWTKSIPEILPLSYYKLTQ